MPKTIKSDVRTGEIIEASTSHFIARSLREDEKELNLPQAPPFGSFVKVKSEDHQHHILGIVYNVETGSLDGTHRPTALNLTRQQIKEQQPQIFDLLKTDFSAITIGYIEKSTYLQHLPPYPPQIHDFVYLCSEKEIQSITRKLFFLRTLLSAPGISDELVAATLRLSYQARGKDRNFLLAAGRELSNLLKDNYDRLCSILQRMEP